MPAVYSPRKYLSVSTLMDFVRCPRRYFYKKSGLSPSEESNALSYGTAMHKAVPACLTEGLDAGLRQFAELWDDSLSDDKRSLRRAQAQLSHYFHSHDKGRSIFSFEKPPPSDIPLTVDVSPYEIPAVLDIGLSVPLVVRLDGLVRHRDTQELWGWEFKTTSRLTSNLFENLEFHPQILVETMVLRTITGENVRGVMAEAMLIDAKKVDNVCHPIPVKDHLVDDAITWLRFWGGMLLKCEEQALDGAGFPKNFAGCSSYSMFYMPSYICDYANLCRVDNWRKLEDLYAIKPEHEFVKLTTGATNVPPNQPA